MINDPLAVAYSLKPGLCGGFAAYTAVETEGISKGQSVVDRMNIWGKTPNSYILDQVDEAGFLPCFCPGCMAVRRKKLGRY